MAEDGYSVHPHVDSKRSANMSGEPVKVSIEVRPDSGQIQEMRRLCTTHSTTLTNTLHMQTPQLRSVFLAKILCMMTVELLVIAGFVAPFAIFKPLNEYTLNNAALYSLYAMSYVFFVLAFLLVWWLSKKEKVRQSNLHSFCCLLALVSGISYMSAWISSLHGTYIVLTMFCMCAVVCACTTVFVLLAKSQASQWSCMVFTFVVLLLFSGLAVFLCVYSGKSVAIAIWGSLLALLITICIAHESHAIMDNPDRSLEQSQIIFGAVQIHLNFSENVFYVLVFLWWGLVICLDILK